MLDSVFTRIFSYRERGNHTPLENYLTEIFAFCLESDSAFRNDFFKKVLDIKLENQEFRISSQEAYANFGRPDIEIEFGSTLILIECKVEANERLNQLADYSNILTELKSDFKNKHVVYLTKYFEYKELNNKKVQLHLIRWFQIHDVIDETHSQITNQLKIFLKTQKMDKIKNFTIQDLLAMKTISETITKMDELLEQFKPEFQKKFGGYSKESSRSTRLPNNCYINFVTLTYDKSEYWLLIGFYWDSETEVPSVGLYIEMPTKKFKASELFKLLNRELVVKRKWEYEEGDSYMYISALKPLTDFITKDEDNIPSIRKYIESCLHQLYEIKAKYPKLLTR